MREKKAIKRTIRIISALVILISISIMIYAILNADSINEQASSQINNYGAPALFAISVFLDLIPQVVSPIIVLAVGLISGINIYYAIIATALGSALGSTLGFIIGKKYMFKAVDILASKKSINTLTYLTNKYGKIIVPIAAISPLPYLPVGLGAINFSKRNFIIFGLIPRAIGIAAYGFLFTIF